MGSYPSGQREVTVNHLAYAFGGSNPPLPTITTATHEAERQTGLTLTLSPADAGGSSLARATMARVGALLRSPVDTWAACLHVIAAGASSRDGGGRRPG